MYRGRTLSAQDVIFIRDLIARHPAASRCRLSALLCEAWGWRQPNGALSDMLARGLMLALHRAGHIALPPPRFVAANNVVRRRPPEPWLLDRSPIEAKLSELQPLEFALVRRTPQERLYDSLIHHHHYLGYTRPVGEHLKYLVSSIGGRPVAALAFSSAPRHLAPRDRFIGWSAEVRRANIRLVAYNPRFLILPWVRVPHLASHLLGRVARQLCADWMRVNAHPVYFMEKKPTAILCTLSRHSSIRRNSAARVIERPTGSISASPPDGAKTTKPTNPIGPSRRYWGIRSCRISRSICARRGDPIPVHERDL
jgi:hypothetical protein